jgi:signal transduction histidine kinase
VTVHPDQAEPPVRSIRRFAPSFTSGAVFHRLHWPEREVSVRSLWYGAAPYFLSIISVAAALAVRLLLQHLGVVGASEMRMTLFLYAIAVSAWYLGTGPGVVAAILSGLVYDYFLRDSHHSLRLTPEQVPFYVAFVLFAVIVTRFTAVRRRVERELLHSRDGLHNEVIERRTREEQIRELNEQLEKRSAELEASNKELEAFAYSISHDLRAPLRHMVGFSELLGQHAATALDEKSRRYTTTILDAAKRMGALIDDLLAFSRIGREETRASTLSLRQLVNEVVEEMRPDLAGRTVSWRIGDLPDLYCDRSMLRMVFMNLITNAIKFTLPRERAEIEIGSFEDARGLVLFVRDNGVGFDMKYSNKLFRVFQRLHRSEEFEGTGIGLATVQRIIQRHGGTVWAEGSVNGGATFFLAVPRALRR